MSNSMLPEYSTKLFCEVWSEAEDFVGDYKDSALYDAYTDTSGTHLQNSLDDATATKLFYLLYARYGNNPIANRDVNQFKYKIFSTIFQYGPTWAKRLDVQVKLRDLSEDDIRLGSKAIYNQAMNPSTAPTTSTLDELTYINQQNTTNYKKSKVDGYAMLLELLDTDVTKQFVDRFKICFKTFVTPERPLIYVSEEDEENDGN